MPSRSYPLRTLVADDHRLFRQGLVSLINARPDLMQVVGEVENGLDAVACCERLHPDLVLLDIFMPVMDGLQAARRILAGNPETIVIMLTASDADQHLEDAMTLGVSGYLPKSLDADELFSLVRAAMEGGVAVTHATALRLLRHVGNKKEESNTPLSSREHQVLLLVAQGASNQAIAENLCISVNTVKSHIKNIFVKRNLASRTQLAAYAMREGLVETAFAVSAYKAPTVSQRDEKSAGP